MGWGNMLSSTPFLQAHCQSPSRKCTDLSFVKELAEPTQKKKEILKNAPPHDKRQ